MIKLVAFDWNGVLIADARLHAQIVGEIQKHYGYPDVHPDTVRDLFEVPVSNMYRKLGWSEEEIEKESPAIQDRFHDLYERRAKTVRTRTGARALLHWLRARSIECVIFSNHTTEGIEAQLKRLHIGGYFQHVIANDKYQAMKGKAKGDKLEAYLRARGYKGDEVLVVGDSPEEVEIGKHLGATTVAITGGYVSQRRLRAANPDHLIHTLTGMIDIIKTL